MHETKGKNLWQDGQWNEALELNKGGLGWKAVDLNLLHDLKEMVIDMQNLKERISELEDITDRYQNKISLPHRCPICNGSTHDDKDSLCIACDGRGIVWG